MWAAGSIAAMAAVHNTKVQIREKRIPHGFVGDMYYDRMLKQWYCNGVRLGWEDAELMTQHEFERWVMSYSAPSRAYSQPVVSQPPLKRVTECRNCGAPKHGAVCEYCKT